MNKNFITLLSIFIISFFFTTNSYAIILENMPTSTKSVQPIPESITSNISNNFDITTYLLIKQSKEENPSKELTENQKVNENHNSNSEIINNQNITTNTKPIIWYFLIFIVVVILYLLFRKIRKNITKL